VDDTECEEDGHEPGKEDGDEAEGWDALLDADPDNYPDYDIDNSLQVLCVYRSVGEKLYQAKA
jgi:hypothetical protein